MGLEDLRRGLEEQGVETTSSTLSALMLRFEDLGLVERVNRKAPYSVRHREAVAGALLHLSSLGLEMAAGESSEAEGLERLSRRAKLQPLDDDDAEETGAQGAG